VQVGDTIRFQWGPGPKPHSVWRIPSDQCPKEWKEGNGLEEIAPPSLSGEAQFTFDTPGTYYFACSVSGGCGSVGTWAVCLYVYGWVQPPYLSSSHFHTDPLAYLAADHCQQGMLVEVQVS
jgi:hypothetical protein